MKLPRIRFTIQRVLIAVALLAVVLSLVIKPILDRRYWMNRGSYHMNQSMKFMVRAERVEGQDNEAYERLWQRYLWHRLLAAKYIRSANYGGSPPSTEGQPPPVPE